MAKPTEKPESKSTAGRDVNGSQKLAEERKKLPPAKPYVIKRRFS